MSAGDQQPQSAVMNQGMEKPGVAYALDEVSTELNGLNAAVSRMEVIVDRITGIGTPPSEAIEAPETQGVQGNILALARETRASTTRLEVLNNRLSELF